LLVDGEPELAPGTGELPPTSTTESETATLSGTSPEGTGTAVHVAEQVGSTVVPPVHPEAIATTTSAATSL
jgi:hypothetical protein